MAMHTGLGRLDPSGTAALLHELGYDGVGCGLGDAAALRSALEPLGLDVLSSYATLDLTGDQDAQLGRIEAEMDALAGGFGEIGRDPRRGRRGRGRGLAPDRRARRRSPARTGAPHGGGPRALSAHGLLARDHRGGRHADEVRPAGGGRLLQPLPLPPPRRGARARALLRKATPTSRR